MAICSQIVDPHQGTETGLYRGRRKGIQTRAAERKEISKELIRGDDTPGAEVGKGAHRRGYACGVKPASAGLTSKGLPTHGVHNLT